MEGLQIVVFSLNDGICGVATSQVKEIVKYEDITKMPRMPKFIEGVINLRGNVVPIVNLNKRFKLGDTEITKKTKVIITHVEGRFIGFIVNDVYEIIRLSSEDIEGTPELIRKVYNDYLKCVGKKGNKLISILDLSIILTDSEMEELDDGEDSDKNIDEDKVEDESLASEKNRTEDESLANEENRTEDESLANEENEENRTEDESLANEENRTEDESLANEKK